jgi:N-acetylneuraminic acid mutarotase
MRPTAQFNQKEGWTQVSTNLSTSGRPPCQRSLHAAAVLRDSIYVFGGYDGLHRVNDLHEFHFPSRSWRQIITLGPLSEGAGAVGVGIVTATGSVPSPRDRHTAVAHGTSLYVFGGFDGTSRVSAWKWETVHLFFTSSRPQQYLLLDDCMFR